MSELPLYKSIRPGDTVTIVTRNGVQRKGRAVMVCATHVVLNSGGPHGTPLIADDSNTIKVTKSKRK